MMFCGKKSRPGHFKRGFTLFEVTVALLIILIITSVVRFSKTKFERSLALTNLAYDIALAIREAQVYGLNTRQTTVTSGADPFNAGYGVRFATGNPTKFALFVDKDNDHYYDSLATCDPTNVSNECLREYSIKNNNKITGLCVSYTTDPTDFDYECSQTIVSILDVTFRRPDPDACLNFNGVSRPTAYTTSQCIAATGQAGAQITIQAANGRTKVIKIYNTGQVVIGP